MIWGWGSDVIDIGSVAEKYCSTCEKTRPFHMFVKYKYSGILFVFNFVTDKEYSLLCNVCHRGLQIDSVTAESMLVKSPIPFMRRMGCLIFFIIVAALYGSMILIESFDNQKNETNASDLIKPSNSDGYIASNYEQAPAAEAAGTVSESIASEAPITSDVVESGRATDVVESQFEDSIQLIIDANNKAKKYSLDSYRYFYSLDIKDEYPRDVYPPKLREFFMPQELSCGMKDCTNYYYGKAVVEIYKWLINNNNVDISTRRRAEIDLDIYVQRSEGVYTNLSVDDASNYVKNAARPYYPQIR